MPYFRNIDKTFVFVIAVLCILLYFLPTGFPTQDDGYIRSKAKVTAVDNQAVYQRGVVQTGVQGVSLQVVDGEFAGQGIEATNTLLGKLEMDKVFQPGDTALVVIKGEKGRTFFCLYNPSLMESTLAAVSKRLGSDHSFSFGYLCCGRVRYFFSGRSQPYRFSCLFRNHVRGNRRLFIGNFIWPSL